MYPFHWVPAAGQRHASLDERPDGALAYPSGTEVSTLCGAQLAADNSVLAWFWESCVPCADETRRIASERTGGGRGDQSARSARNGRS
ncbi:zinc finger protein [Saccharopolyspora phatthalungensis]|uniref:zinc finger protein n=1 Tax=Saccharopolyspora phatthalungensis TaxID=664693 RepID=UPI00160DF6BF|nr:zinc finger protein [Saccharopolyspora phatthalungensis]